MPKINALPAMTTVADDDVFAADDVSTANKDTKKVTFTKLKEWLQSLTSWITHSMVSTGFVVQEVATNYSAASTGTTIIPQDDTIPQSGEGFEVMTQAITPKSATNELMIAVTVYGGSSVGDDLIVALFKDSDASAIATVGVPIGASGGSTITFKHKITSGTTSSITFKVRFGGSQAGTRTFNGRIGTRVFGAITKSSIKITEVKA